MNLGSINDSYVKDFPDFDARRNPMTKTFHLQLF